MTKRKTPLIRFVTAVLLLWAGAAWAAAPTWMPNFPMRMGAAGTMLMWMPVPGATEYKVFRRVGDGEWEQVAKVPMNTYQDPTAPQDKDVAYKVVPVIGGKDGEESKTVVLKGVKPIDPPSNLLHRLQDKTVLLRWNPVPGASFYNVYRSTGKEGPFELVASVQEAKYTDPKVEDGKTYYYVVTSVSPTSQESKKPAPYEVKVAFPKKVVVKKFDPVRRMIKLVATSQGEDFAEFLTPSDVVLHEGRLYIPDEKGVQVLDTDGTYLERLAIVQEMVGTQQWKRPVRLTFGPEGTIFVTFLNSPVIREISADGTRVVREIVPPALPDNPFRPRPASVDVGPDGRLWIVDSAYSQVVILPADATAPREEEVTRIGWPRGSKEGPPEGQVRFFGLALGRFWYEKGYFCPMESGEADILFINAETLALVGKVGGQGGGLHQFTSIGDFKFYDDQSVMVLDVLGKSIRRIDANNGDYIESFVDDEEKLNLQAPGSISRFEWDPRHSRLYVLSGFENKLYIYDVVE